MSRYLTKGVKAVDAPPVWAAKRALLNRDTFIPHDGVGPRGGLSEAVGEHVRLSPPAARLFATLAFTSIMESLSVGDLEVYAPDLVRAIRERAWRDGHQRGLDDGLRMEGYYSPRLKSPNPHQKKETP